MACLAQFCRVLAPKFRVFTASRYNVHIGYPVTGLGVPSRRTAGFANVAELVDALDLGSSGATRESSSLSFRTIYAAL